jgi:methionyl aminopeptidase
MITIKTEEEIEKLREGGKRLARILDEVSKAVAPGVEMASLNALAEKLIREYGDTSAFLHYKPYGAKRPFPASLCVSVNDEIVHGIPNESVRVLQDGDIVSLDLGLIHEGLVTDSALTVAVGAIDAESKHLLEVTKKALNAGIKAVKAGTTVGDIGFAIQESIKPHAFGIIRELCGHGVGYSVHEDPFVPNFGVRGRGARLKSGMVIAIEPMLTLGAEEILLAEDGYTYKTADGSRSAHFEHTIVVTDKGAEILTQT